MNKLKNNKLTILFIFIFLFFSLSIEPFASELVENKITLAPNEIKVKVSGVVCSFCAYGVERNLSKLSFLDKEKFGEDGVLIDISTQIVTVATNPKKVINLGQVFNAILKGGYEPKVFYLNIFGEFKKKGQFVLLKDKITNQEFEFRREDVYEYLNLKPSNFKIKVETEEINALKKGTLVRATLIK